MSEDWTLPKRKKITEAILDHAILMEQIDMAFTEWWNGPSRPVSLNDNTSMALAFRAGWMARHDDKDD